MKKLLPILLLLALFCYSVNAETAFEDDFIPSLPTVAQGECVQVLQLCSNCTYVNITSILYPGGVLNLQALPLVRTANTYNRTFCNTTLSGDYLLNWEANPDGTKASGAYTLRVTKSGEDREINPFTPLVALLFFGIVCLVLSLTLPYTLIKYTLLALTVLTAYVSIQFTLVVIQGYALVNDLSTNEFLVTFFQVFTWIISGAATLILIFTFVQIRNWFQIRKGFRDA